MKAIAIPLLLLASAGSSAFADAVTIDFEGDGRSPFHAISDPQYRLVEKKGIRGSQALLAANYTVATLDGKGGKSFPAGTFTKGGKVVVGTFFKFSAFPNVEKTTPPSASANALRIGLTGGPGKRFSGMPSACLLFTGQDGRGILRIATSGQQGNGFKLKPNQWYYFEAGFTRLAKSADNPKETKVRYELSLKEATNEGLLADEVVVFDSIVDNPGNKTIWHDPAGMNGVIHAAFKGDAAFGQGASAVIDNFFFGRP